MAETLQLLSIISFAVGAVCLGLAIFLWFFFKIPNVIGDLSGRNARKSIARMREANEKSGSKSYKESKANAERGKLTGTMQGIRKKKTDSSDDNKLETGLLNENKAEGFESEATGVLESETTGLLGDDEVTAPLNVSAQKPKTTTDRKKLKMIEEVIFIHTDEVIE